MKLISVIEYLNKLDRRNQWGGRLSAIDRKRYRNRLYTAYRIYKTIRISPEVKAESSKQKREAWLLYRRRYDDAMRIYRGIQS